MLAASFYFSLRTACSENVKLPLLLVYNLIDFVLVFILSNMLGIFMKVEAISEESYQNYSE
jgi:hypothetical protein